MPQLFGAGNGAGGVFNNFAATADPGTGNDADEGYVTGSRWINTTSGKLFTCFDPTVAAAVWVLIDSVLNNTTAVVAPVVGDDNLDGYEVGSQWVDLVLNTVWFCADASTGAAVWVTSSGNVVGPGTSVNNAVALWDGTTGQLLASASTFKFQSGTVTLSGVTASINMKERATGPSPAAATGEFWVKDGVPSRPRFSDDAAGEYSLIGDWGQTPQDAAVFTERTDHVNTPGTTRAELWLKNATSQYLKFTDESAADRAIMMFDRDDDGTGLPPTTDGIIPVFDSGTGVFGQPTDTFAMQSNELKHLGTDAIHTMAERSAAPTSTTGRGKTWVRSTSPARKWYTDDLSQDQRLGMQSVSISFDVSPTATDDWFGWTNAGPYNDALWSENWGTAATPTVANYRDKPPLIVLPGDTKIERVVGWYTSENASPQNFQMELIALAFEDQDAYASIVADTICDGSTNGNEITVANTKVAIADHTINDSSALPTDTSHMIGLYMCFRETTAVKIGTDLNGCVTIYWSTYSVDGWH